jgi:DNA polymerase I-like protein with 3'-5' exonuclease and polymerase domains
VARGGVCGCNKGNMSEEFDDDMSDLLAMAEESVPAENVPEPAKAAEVAVEPTETPADPDIDIDELMSDDTPEPKPVVVAPEVFDDPMDFLENSGLTRDRKVPLASKPWMINHDFKLVESVAELNEIVNRCIASGFCSLDLETEGLDNRINYVNGRPETVHKIVGYCISYDGQTGYYVPVRHAPTDGAPAMNVGPLVEVEQSIIRLCQAAIPEGTKEDKERDPLSYKCSPPKLVIGFWNAQFDHEFLYPVTGIDWWHPDSFEDGLLAGFTLHAGDKNLGLKPKSKQYLADKEGNPYEMVELKELFNNKSKDIDFKSLAPDEVGLLRYAGSDAICTYLLCKKPGFIDRARAKKFASTYRLEKQVTQMLRQMERNRVLIAREKMREILIQKEAEKAEVLKRIQEFALLHRKTEIDPNSPMQLSKFLFGEPPEGLNLSPKPEKNEASGQYKTDAETLEGLAKRADAPTILKDIVTYREAEKFIGTYLLSLVNNPDHNDELRFSFKQTGAGSGRFSAPAGKPDHGYSGVPVHGIPADSEVRRGFIARPGYTLVKADYAAEELRIAANVSDEKVWIKEFLHGTGDLHSITARSIFGKQELSKAERTVGKIVNFLLLFGGGPKAVMRNTGCDELEGKRRKLGFDKSVPTFVAWSKLQHKQVKKDLGVTTPFGRFLAIPDANHADPAIRAACERHATNYQIQGGGADILKISMVLLHKEFNRRGWLKTGQDIVRILLCVHDEIVFEVKSEYVPEAVPLIVDIMESPWKMPIKPKWQVPLVVEPLIGYNWASGYKAERFHGQKLEDGDVVVNGFLYATKRKPKTLDDGTIIENLDTGEILDGKKFRAIDPPWLSGKVQGTPPEETPPPASTAPTNPAPVPPVTAAAPAVTAPVPPPRQSAQPQARSSSDVFTVAIDRLNSQTAEQICEFISLSGDYVDGVNLQLIDPSGEILVPAGQFRVSKEKFMKLLGASNLI